MAFAHLHVHTEYSLLDGSNKIKEYISRVKELGMNSAAITDHGVMYGVIDFYKEAHKRGVRPIIGCEIYVAPESRFDREPSDDDDRYHHLVLLAENNIGYQNLMKIVSLGFTEGFYYRPRVDKEVLRSYSEGLIALSACLGGEVQRCILRGKNLSAKEAALEYEEIFGKGNFFLELQDHGMQDQRLVNQVLLGISEETGIELVVTNDIHYTRAEDEAAHDILLCIQTGKTLSDENRMKYEGGQFYVKSEAEMKQLFPYALQAIENTQKIAERCHVEIEFGVTKLPEYDVPEEFVIPRSVYSISMDTASLVAKDINATYINSELNNDEIDKIYINASKCIPTLPMPEEFNDHDNSTQKHIKDKEQSEKEERSKQFLYYLCYKGLEERYGTNAVKHYDRLEFELKTIVDMGFVDYFLITWDFIKYAKDHDIMVGPGRGSAAGCIVAYCLQITDVDPIKYNLLFERFLNPERISMPDIDIDFCYERRQEVIDYVVQKYGIDRVVQIITFGTMAARGVIRDVGRVMDLSYAFVDNIAKMIPQELNITLTRALEMNPELRKNYEEDEQVKALIDMSLRLEGLPRHSSMHAAGVVISKQSIDEYVPVSRASDGSITTQFPMNTLEELGLLKMDFLGLRTLTVIQNATKLIEARGEVVPFSKTNTSNTNEVEYDDPKVLSYIGTGKTDGIFQVESAGMKSFMKELKPEKLEDLIAGISLYRPGPMDFIPQYIRGKNNANSITFECPELVPILEPTYGCIVYQEQVMQIVRDLAGFSLGRSDLMRRAMSKKKADVMQKERQVFIHGDETENVPGCLKNGISEEVANHIYDQMMEFASYAFNKSHAAAYAIVSYETAWLKYYYPVEFMAALMTSVMDHTTKVSEYIYACKQMNLSILPPNVNRGLSGFSVDDGQIRFALSAIKNVGRGLIKHLVDDREEYGKFLDLEDFIRRITLRDSINKRAIENFIKAGAFDCFEGYRRQFMMVYSTLVDEINREKKSAMAGQMTLFEMAGDQAHNEFKITMPKTTEYDMEQLLGFEKEVLGVYISGHPMDRYEEQWKRSVSKTTLDFQLDDESNMTKVVDGAKEIIGGMIVEITTKFTRTNQVMAFVMIEDMLGTVEVIVFPRDYEKYKSLITPDSKVLIKGRVANEDDKPSKLICEQIIPFQTTNRELWIQYPDKAAYLWDEDILQGFLQDSEGDDVVVIYCQAEKVVKRLPRRQAVSADVSLMTRLQNYFGESRVKLVEKKVESKF